LAEGLKKILINEFDNIYFISTGRGIEERIQTIRDLQHINAGVGIRGENTISVIHHLRTNDIDIPLFQEIARRAGEFGINLTTQIDGSNTSVICKDENLPISVNVVDAGFGLNQLLPIIVQSYIAREGSTILIEEPETHLHEAAQYKLLDMFLDIIGKGKQAIITSHSVALRSKTKRNYDEGQKHPHIEQCNSTI
jgi:predicted ATPase